MNNTKRSDVKFRNIYIELQKEYNLDIYSSNDNYSSLKVDELLEDLHEKIKCQSVEILIYNQDNALSSLTTYKKEKSILEDQIILKEIKEKLSEFTKIERNNGDSFIINDVINFKGFQSIDIDIIPVSRNNTTSKDRLIYIFALVCPALLKDISRQKAERQFQRLLLSQLLKEWWFKITKVSPPNSMFGNAYAISLAKLVQIGLDSVKHIRQNNSSMYFNEESNEKRFNWDYWNPELYFYTQSESRNKFIRQHSESLIYWCRWDNSHKDLEDKNDKEEVKKTVEWIKKQKQEINSILRHLDNLQNLSTNEFIEGNVEFCPNTNMQLKKEGLPLVRKSLLIYSLNKWVGKDCFFRKEITSGALSDVEFCRALHALASVSHYLFCQQPLTDDVIHRLMQLISQYGHSELRIPSRIDLRAHLLHTVRGEPALYVLKSFYRDHFFHALEVCFLGDFLLEIKIDEDLCLWQIVAKKLNIDNDDKKKVLRLWYTAALLHDVGYAIDMFNNSQKYLEFFKHSKAIINYTKQIKDLKKGLEEEIKDLGVLFDNGMEDDHGIIGALHLQSLINDIAKEDSTVSKDEFKHSIYAIAMHNLRRKEDKISFSSHPIAFLLAFCDQIQEWNRFRMPYSISPNIILSRLIENGGKIDNFFGGISDVFINSVEAIQNNDGIEIKMKDKTKLEFTLEYDDNINKESNVFSLWLDSTLNFQRLDFEGLPFDIKVNFKTPCYHDDVHDNKTPQLHRLRNAAHETHMTFLSDWFPNERKGELLTNGPVDYREDNEMETLSLNLKELSKKRLMTKGMSAFYKRLREWKQYNDDRDFPGDYVEVYPE